MNKKYLDALTFLSSFNDGLSHYNWDRAMTYKLKYGIHPGEFIRYFIDEGLIENKVAIMNSSYRLSPLGKSKVEENRKDLKSIEDVILKSIAVCGNNGWEIEVENRLPFFKISYFGRALTLLINRDESEVKLVCYFPSETNLKVNEISLAVSMLQKTEILSDLIESHLKYLSIL